MRFLLFAFTSLLVLIALFNLGVEVVGQTPELGPLVGWHSGHTGLPGGFVLGSWALEALALTALFTLVDTGRRSRWLSGLLTGWSAWVFRGPLLVLAAVGFGHLAGGPWWHLSLRWFALYTVAGLVLGLVATLTSEPPAVVAEPEARPAAPAAPPAPQIAPPEPQVAPPAPPAAPAGPPESPPESPPKPSQAPTATAPTTTPGLEPEPEPGEETR